MSRKRLGALLREKGLIDQAQLDEAIREQRRTGQALGEALLKLGRVSELDLVEVLSEQQGIPFVDVEGYALSPELVQELSPDAARRACAIPLYRMGGTTTVAMSDPLDMGAVDVVARSLGGHVNPVYGTATAIRRVVDEMFGTTNEIQAAIEKVEAEGGAEDGPQEDEDLNLALVSLGDEQKPVVRLVRAILNDAIDRGATDVHIEPEEEELAVRFRIDGMLAEQARPPKRLQGKIVSRVKVLAQLDIAERRLPQSGRIRYERDTGQVYDLRISCFPTVYGENLVIRILHRDSALLQLDRLGIPETDLTRMRDVLRQSNGIVLVTGPTGSGKTTTLYAALSDINEPHRKIHTLEDPVEYRLPGVRQTQVNPKVDLTFAKSLRELVRQDPDVILVGEIRDTETAEIAVHASLTGHLVLSTLHTNSAAASVARLVNMGVEPYLVASSMRAVVSQRLVRVLCEACKQEDPESARVAARLGLPDDAPLWQAPGCGECRGAGYRGRRAIHEVLIPDLKIQDLMIQKAPASKLEAAAREQGLVPLRERGFELALSGVTSVTEVLRVT